MAGWSLDEIRQCVKKTVDDCLSEIVADRPAVRVSPAQRAEQDRLVDGLARLFMEIRLKANGG